MPPETKNTSTKTPVVVPALEPKTPSSKKPPDPVQQASEESFPASDPPAPGGSTSTATPGADWQPKKDAKDKDEKPEKKRPVGLEPDKVGEASEESFPASDPPAWGTSHA